MATGQSPYFQPLPPRYRKRGKKHNIILQRVNKEYRTIQQKQFLSVKYLFGTKCVSGQITVYTYSHTLSYSHLLILTEPLNLP